MQDYEARNSTQVVSEVDGFTLERYEQFQKFLGASNRRILDVGCNTGRGGVRLKEIDPGLTISGLDCVKSRLEQLPTDVYAEGIYGLANSIPVDDGTFDAVVAGEFIEHLSHEDVQSTLKEFLRVIRPGGRVLLTTPNPGFIRLKLNGTSVLDEESHLSEHWPSGLKRELRQVGFIKVKCYGTGRMTRYLGYSVPIMPFYGSFLAVGDKPKA